MKTNAYPERALWRETRRCRAHSPSSATADAALEFDRFRVLLRQRQLLADDAPVKLGTRTFDLRLEEHQCTTPPIPCRSRSARGHW
jgi:hypothetical protein